jgi:glycosyltransferase involved in cell wall biosynthesis
MKVTIITPTFNSLETLPHTLLSVERQSYPDIEHLIIDNQSTDGTLELIANCKHNVRVVSEKDKGIFDAMNKGIALAQGEIIGILNSDDYLSDKDTIALIVEKFEHDKCDAVYGNLVYVRKDNPDYIQRVWIAGEFKKRSFHRGWMPPHPTFYIKKEIYSKFGLFDLDLRYSSDYEMMLRLLLKHKIKVSFIKKVLVYMRAGGNSNSSLTARLNVNTEDRLAWKKVGIKPDWHTLHLKPVRKLHQYFVRYFIISWLIHIPPSHNNESFLQGKS